MKKLKVFISSTHNPWFNLATEDWIFREMDPEYHVLFLWRNQETVVIGRFQNPWTECRLDAMEKDGVLLARRQSGGGAVFHDLNNTNFTFLSGKQSYSKEANNNIIVNALKALGVSSYASGRNDILMDINGEPRKISGSAFKQTKDRAFHHGTMLINSDLGKLNNYLTPHQKKIESKGISSVRSRVANITEVNPKIHHELFCKQMIQSFFDHYGDQCEIEELNPDELQGKASLQNYYESLKDWKWRFGETPKFEHQMSERFEWGGMEVHLNSHKGMITESKIFSDSLHPEMVELLESKLSSCPYSKSGIEAACLEAGSELPMVVDYIQEFSLWLQAQIA